MVSGPTTSTIASAYRSSAIVDKSKPTTISTTDYDREMLWRTVNIIPEIHPILEYFTAVAQTEHHLTLTRSHHTVRTEESVTGA